MKKHSVSFVVAGYNEEKNVAAAVSEIWTVLNREFSDFEIILVDDGSKDHTLERMRECQEKYTNIVVLDNLINMNFGASVLRGVKAAQKDYVVYDAFDLPLTPSDFIIKFRQMLEWDSDVLVLERESYPCTPWRKVTSNLNVLLLKFLFPDLTRGTPILNFTQIFRRDVIDSLLPLARSPIFVWPEMVFRAKLRGLKVDNLLTKPDVKEVRKGSFGHPHDIIWGIYEMLRFRIRLWNKNI